MAATSSIPSTKCVGEIIVDEARGEVICTSTGEIIGTLIDYNPEWRDFPDTNAPSRSRVGSPLTHQMHDYGVASYIARRDVYRLGTKNRRLHLSMIRHNAANRIKGHKREIRALQILRIEGSRLNLPQRTLETASEYIKKVVRKRLGRGEMIRAYIAAAIFIASRVTGVPRSFSSIIRELNVEEEKARHAYRAIIELHGGKIKARVYKPVDYIPMISTKLGLSKSTQELMYRLARAVEKLNLIHGKSPIAITAAIAYISSSINGEKKNQREIADAIGSFTDVAIRNRYREIIDKLYIEVAL